jgi:TonB family protein
MIDRLHRASAINSIDDPQLKPWHLKLSFQLFDDKGTPSEQGTIEEWWGGPTAHKILYSSPSYTSTEVQSKDDLYRSRGRASVPNLLELVLRQVVHPMPNEQDVLDSKPDLRKETLGKEPLDCIMLDQQIKTVAYPPLGLFPTYCFDRGEDSLRVTDDVGSEVIARNRIGVFQGRNVAVDQATTLGQFIAIKAHLDALQGAPYSEDDLSSANFEKINQEPVSVGSGVVAGSRIKGTPPIYPEAARRNHVSGTVTLDARIGRDGHIHSLKIRDTPDADLAIAAIAAVRQWTYKPYHSEWRACRS